MTSLSLLLALSLAATEAGADRPVFDVRFVILGVPSGPATLTAERWMRFGEANLLTGALDAKWGAESLRSEGTRLLVNGKPLSLDAASAGGPGAGLRVLSSPLVSVPAGETATLKFGTAGTPQYFVKDTDGRFSLKAAPLTPELQLDIDLDKEAGGEGIGATLSYRLVVVGARARIEGVDLDVGEPSLRQDSGKGRLQAKLGHWSLLMMPAAAPSAPPLAVLVRVTK
ncbi:MAG: hypothetical protein U0599_26840 [Vicinamibacteria bacterium]